MASRLDDFLQQNPAYKVWPQDELLRSLHEKFYADLPYDKFENEVTTDAAPPVPEDEPFYKRIGKAAEVGLLSGTEDVDVVPEGAESG